MTDALKTAEARQNAAAKLGFDWPEIAGVWDKLHEEIRELQQANSQRERIEELGDLLFMLVNLARHLNIDPQHALRQGTDKFDRRFAVVCKTMREQGVAMSAETLPQMEAAWEHAKRLERAGQDGYRSDSSESGDTD